MATVNLRNLVKAYGKQRAVDDISLDIAEGELLVLLGPSGCGKTTTLKMIAGFVEATSGQIVIGDRDVTRVPPYRRNLGVVFQNYALFPHLTVFENIAFPLRRRRMPKGEIGKAVERAMDIVQLATFGDRLPRQLSGGQQQRVAIARALVFRPDVLLLDEPLSNLDAKLRLEVRQQIRHLQKESGITTVMVTHDQDEAMSVGDRLVVMKSGVIQQVGSAVEIYRHPANDFVASFIGAVNFISGTIDATGCFRTESGMSLPGGHLPPRTRRVVVRPEAIALFDPAAGPADAMAATVREATYLGAYSEIVVALDAGPTLTARVQNGPGTHPTEAWQPGRRLSCVIGHDALFPLAE